MVPFQNLHLIALAGIGHANLEQEAVQLRFGQGIGAFEIDRILRGEDREPGRQRSAHAVRGYLPLFHAFEQCGLGAGRHAVDLVHQQQIGEDGAGVEAEALRTSFGSRAQNRGAQNVGGHQVRRGLHALESEAQQTAQRFDDQRLGDAGHAFEQRMTLAEDGDHHLLDRSRLAGDHAPQLGAGVGHQLVGCVQPLRSFRVLV